MFAKMGFPALMAGKVFSLEVLEALEALEAIENLEALEKIGTNGHDECL
jgi:hypothetical protein